MRLLFVARAIDAMAGGVERIIIIVMNALVQKGYEVHFLTWDLAGAKSFYPLAEGITWHRLNLGDPAVKADVRLKLRRAAAVRQLIKQVQPDTIVCFQSGTFMAMRAYTWGMGVPVIAAERNAPTRFEFTRAGRYQKLTYNAFRSAKRVLVQCESYRSLYPAYLQNRIVTIPNPVFPAEVFARPHIPGPQGRFRLLSVGRLSYQKNFPVLIAAFATLADRFPDWDLIILGEGENRAELTELVKAKKLGDRVLMPGVTSAVSKEYAAAHLFCLPSRWEGFPNALAEALAHGLPGVGFADCAGMRDLFVPDKNGLLAAGNGHAESLATALGALMGDAQVRQMMGKAAIVSVQPYQPEQIFSRWEAVLAEAIDR